MNGKNHERILCILLFPILFYLGSIHANTRLSIVFALLWLIGTFYITCDDDTKSRSRKRLGFIGWIIDKLFHHRGTLHKVWFWGLIGAIGYYEIGWPIAGLVFPQGVHILTDKISTGVKRAF